MNFFSIAYYTILRNIRDTKSLIQVLLLPIVTILILGTALDGAFAPPNISKTPVCYLNQDSGKTAEQFEAFLNDVKIRELLKLVPVKSYEEGVALINDRRASALIMIPDDFSTGLETGQKARIHVYSSRYGNFRSSIVRNVVDSFINRANAMEAVYKMNLEDVRFDSAEADVIREMPISTSGKIPRAMDYYAVTMLVMIAMYGTLYGVDGFAEDYFVSVGTRIKSSPIRAYEHYAGKAIGVVFTIFSQSIFLILFSKYVFGANWGNNMLTILLIAFSLSVLSTVFGIMLCILTWDQSSASAIANVLIPVFTLLSGGYMKFVIDNQAFNRLRHLIPNYLAQTAIFNNIYGSRTGQSYMIVAAIWAMTLVMFFIAFIAGRRRVQ
ncbi:MAG: ABC transporter permease [Firmicutes bacterium]|nr:ABC transporter permease [Bacillota bacterium]